MQGFSVFIPVLDEERLLAPNALAVLEHCRGLGREFELIIGSNGSTDRTAEIGRSLADEHPELRFFHLEAKGAGRAFARAVRVAAQPFLITLDMDLSVGPDFITTALEHLERGAAVVVGSKQAGRQERGLLRVLASGAFIAAARLVLSLSFRDYSLGAKAFTTELARRYLSDIDPYTGYTLALIYRAQQEGARVVEVPVVCRDSRQSRFSLGGEGFYRLRHLWRVKKPPDIS